MNQLEKDLKQIRQIRKHRVNSLRRIMQQKAQATQKAETDIQDLHKGHEELQQSLMQQENDALGGLTNGEFVKVDRLVGFTKLQQSSIKKMKDSRNDIESGYTRYRKAREEQLESSKHVSQAEKKLVKIEEVIDGKLWN